MEYFCIVIEYNKLQLRNGLCFIHVEDKSRTSIVLNTLYRVGARDEDEERTGFAHLFEHLMFSGSANVPIFDKEVEEAGGQNNAFTNNDFTNYYLVMPQENVETAFWLESDRMFSLNINENSLKVQQGVVVEEFKQRCFNAPFGMLWHHIRKALYEKSSYRWPTIGLTFEHIEEASLQNVQSFYNKFYCPSNAIVSLVGNISWEKAQELAEKWFGSIEPRSLRNSSSYISQEKLSPSIIEETDLSPNPAIFLVWEGPSVKNLHDSLCMELFAELLGGSDVSPLQIELVKKQQLFNASECFYLKGIDEGMFILYGILNDGISFDTAKEGLFTELNKLYSDVTFSERLIGVKNRISTQLLVERTQPMQIAQKLCYYENIDSLSLINQETSILDNITAEDITAVSKKVLNNDIFQTIHYTPKSNA
ncbi:MAG: M16 family metallopeptidase [Bacteroidota bacterium]|jgi:zinc protease